MLPVLIQEFSQSKHYPYTALLSRKTVHTSYSPPELPECPLYDIRRPYPIPMSVRKTIEGKTNIQIPLKTPHSLRHLLNPSVLPLLKPNEGLSFRGGIKDPLGRRDYFCLESLRTIEGNIPYLMNHTPLQRYPWKDGINGPEQTSIAIKGDEGRRAKPPSFKVKEEILPTPLRLPSTKDKTKKLPSATLCYPYGTQKGLFAYPVPPKLQIYGIKEEIPYRLIYRSVKVGDKLLFKVLIEIRDLGGTILHPPEGLAYRLYLPCRYPPEEYIRDDPFDLFLPPLPPPEDRREEPLPCPGDGDLLYQTKPRLKVLEEITVPVISPLSRPLVGKTPYKSVKLLIDGLLYDHPNRSFYPTLKGIEELLRTIEDFYSLFTYNFFWTGFYLFGYTFHKAYPPFRGLIPLVLLSHRKDKPILFEAQENLHKVEYTTKIYKLFPGCASIAFDFPIIVRIRGEQSLFFNVKDKGMVLVTGCGHQSLITLADFVQKNVVGGGSMYGVYGGLHLAPFGPIIPKRAHIITEMGKFNFKKVACNHCTGLPAVQKMVELGYPVVRGTARYGSISDLYVGNGDEVVFG